MGASGSSPEKPAPALEALAFETNTVLRCIAGRIIDLPGGDEARITPDVADDAGSFSYFKFTPSSKYNHLKFIGRAYALTSSRKFVLYLSSSYRVFGYEEGTGLHLLARSLREFLQVRGLSNRDLRVVDQPLLNSRMERLSFPLPTREDLDCAFSGEFEPAYTSMDNLLSECDHSPAQCRRPRRHSTASSTAIRSMHCEHQRAHGSVIDLRPPHLREPSVCPSVGAPERRNSQRARRNSAPSEPGASTRAPGSSVSSVFF
ncbi:myristylated tegument protein CIRC [Equid alphaherpesvirus 3]|uniref:Myristylated tegument protein CIRC n=1 Tax=Equid alphaherpesvirus 3 TaxID=80341 RepID=A0A077B5V7_9ALPH|nr:myristylated tegument protein CIRC [Equid alphaherpesvirus 3]AIL02920.1 myristylated tegument protein CIRC [Equid alphaherpesvirus 3]